MANNKVYGVSVHLEGDPCIFIYRRGDFRRYPIRSWQHKRVSEYVRDKMSREKVWVRPSVIVMGWLASFLERTSER